MRYALAFLFLALAFPVHAQTITGRASVIDGDTLEIHGTRIRLHGIDAPESGQFCTRGGRRWRCGQQAALALADRIGQRPVSCDHRDIDRYRRVVAVCRADGVDLNGWMVSQGWAMAYRQYSTDYVRQEREAKRDRAGIWSGEFMAPWKWRQAQSSRERTSRSKPASQRCDIKGNISRNGRIYHIPGGRYYDRTRIDESRGEKWFCSEAEARAAGWRRSRR